VRTRLCGREVSKDD